MRQLQLFTTAQLATMRDTTKRRNYSAEAEEFRREHQRHRVWGMTQRHARKLRSIYGHMPTDEELMAGWHDGGSAASACGTSEQAHSRPAVRSESTPSMPEQTVPERVEPEQVEPEQVEPATAVAERGAMVGAAGCRPEHSTAASGRADESGSALEEAIAAAAPVRRAPGENAPQLVSGKGRPWRRRRRAPWWEAAQEWRAPPTMIFRRRSREPLSPVATGNGGGSLCDGSRGRTRSVRAPTGRRDCPHGSHAGSGCAQDAAGGCSGLLARQQRTKS
jgi:hypothetical protein